MNSDHETIVRQAYDAFARADVSVVIAARDPAIRRQEALAAFPQFMEMAHFSNAAAK